MSFPSIKQNVTLIISEHLVLHVFIVLGVNDEARIPLNVMAGQVCVWDLNSGRGIRIPH